MNNPVVYTRTMTGSAITLAPTAAQLVASVDITAPSANVAAVVVTGPDGTYSLEAGETRWLDNVDLNTLTVNGTSGDKVKVMGNTVR